MAGGEYTAAAIAYGEAMGLVPFKPLVPSTGGELAQAIEHAPGLVEKKIEADTKATTHTQSASCVGSMDLLTGCL